MVENLKAFISTDSGIWFGAVVDSGGRLEASAFSFSRDILVRRLRGIACGRDPVEAEDSLIEEMIKIFNGQDASRVQLNLSHATAFQARVYRVLQRIPKSKVTSYGLISKTIGSAPRAVGGAVASNRFAPFVPCHRVLPADLSIGNYSMNNHPSLEGSKVKREMLVNEGVVFQKEKVDRSCLWNPGL